MATGTTRPHKGKERTYEQWDLARAVTQAGDVVADFFVGRGRWIQKFLREGRHVEAEPMTGIETGSIRFWGVSFPFEKPW